MKPEWQPELEKILLKHKNKENEKTEKWNESVLGDDFFNQLHDKIMLEVENNEIKNKPIFNSQKQKIRRILNPIHLKESAKKFSHLGLKLSVTLSALFFGYFTIYNSVVSTKTPDHLVRTLISESKQNPELFSDSMLNSQTQFDLIQELANKSDKSLTTNDL